MLKEINPSVNIMISPVVELLAAMFRTNCHEQLRSDSDSDYVPIELEKWVNQTRKALTPEMKSELEVFFNFESFFGMTLISNIIFSKQHDNVHSFISHLKDLSPLELITMFTETGYGTNRRIPSPIKDHTELISFINEMNLPEVEKWKLTYLCANAADSKNRFVKLIEEFYQQFYLPESERLAQIHNDSLSELENELQDNLEQKVGKLLNLDYDSNNVIFIPSYFYDSCSFSSYHDETEHLIYGYGVRSLQIKLHEKINEEKLYESFKALADENRIKMIKILIATPCSGYELAKKLGLSNSTISHHVSILSSQGVLTITKQDKKNLYTVNKDFIKITLESMSNFLTE
ncbi:ArsR/SmtB family transcription factor [Anaerobacillus isosaccharinicus]|uniref:Winged helix-turn-helix transcriptional regulator n=1 Tax=Anaerobacillus isosaccharinicus TaxID=1532552 RepID=A0A1S2MF49_9BACI|nr:metalloregulator ArsR/SmtB family transcription factor [Anaerobacillus isosaccharinicus]MBA5586462.1 winged helix-turn-helix transcriptional regulator [Anaerobacillus isosaccharinicus]QOY35295.1 winged helix-turn-helix transcriptional regulator [Anaerobacillus isosaccharinicus]